MAVKPCSGFWDFLMELCIEFLYETGGPGAAGGYLARGVCPRIAVSTREHHWEMKDGS